MEHKEVPVGKLYSKEPSSGGKKWKNIPNTPSGRFPPRQPPSHPQSRIDYGVVTGSWREREDWDPIRKKREKKGKKGGKKEKKRKRKKPGLSPPDPFSLTDPFISNALPTELFRPCIWIINNCPIFKIIFLRYITPYLVFYGKRLVLCPILSMRLERRHKSNVMDNSWVIHNLT